MEQRYLKGLGAKDNVVSLFVGKVSLILVKVSQSHFETGL
jgi:hypothetical protein